MMRSVMVTSASAEETFRLGSRIGEIVRGGSLLALYGELGAGKTQFARGLAAGLGVDPRVAVASPTFVLMREHIGRLRLFHMDAYRLGDESELESTGIDELRADPGAVIAIEWAERTPEFALDADWQIRFAHRGPESREITIVGPDFAMDRLGL